jgi:hypothetical protein
MTYPDDAGTHDPPARPPYRAPIGMPLHDEGRRKGAVVSILLHALVIALVGLPFVFSPTVIRRIEQGAGGAGPAGGGGGGKGGGNEGYRETLRYVRLAPEPVPTPTKLPPIPTPVVPKVQPPVPQVTPPVQPAVKAPEQAAVPAPVQTVASTAGGAGTGNDGTAGNGPGTGGGTGAGNGPGKGGGNGPGTGGGTQANYPPQPVEFFLPPLPAPSSVHGFHFVAEFDVDSTGRVLDVKMSESRDGDYNRRLASILRSMRFKPGTRPDGTPLRMKAQLGWDF